MARCRGPCSIVVAGTQGVWLTSSGLHASAWRMTHEAQSLEERERCGTGSGEQDNLSMNSIKCSTADQPPQLQNVFCRSDSFGAAPAPRGSRCSLPVNLHLDLWILRHIDKHWIVQALKVPTPTVEMVF